MCNLQALLYLTMTLLLFNKGVIAVNSMKQPAKQAALLLFLFSILPLSLIGCSDSDKKPVVGKEHVWKGQEEALNKAKQIEDAMKKSDEKLREKLQ